VVEPCFVLAHCHLVLSFGTVEGNVSSLEKILQKNISNVQTIFRLPLEKNLNACEMEAPCIGSQCIANVLDLVKAVFHFL